MQGGSAAAGWPYSYGGAFSRMLEQRLAQTFPDRDVEVVVREGYYAPREGSSPTPADR